MLYNCTRKGLLFFLFVINQSPYWLFYFCYGNMYLYDVSINISLSVQQIQAMYSRGNTSGLSSISYGSNFSGGSQPRKPGQKNKRVQVWARVRPTSEFAYDNLELLPDGKVCYRYQLRDIGCLWLVRLGGLIQYFFKNV